jgi:hypothetical protein
MSQRVEVRVLEKRCRGKDEDKLIVEIGVRIEVRMEMRVEVRMMVE